MNKAPQELNTSRLLLRKWQEKDLLPFAKMNADPEVMRYFPSTLTAIESDKLASRIQEKMRLNGWGLWAVEESETGKFAGFVGLNEPNFELPYSPCVEIGWRLAKEFWGKGYATEAAKKVLEFAFQQFGFTQLVSFTSLTNKPSIAVMERIGMHNTGINFHHPNVAEVSPLSEHVLYRVTFEQWRNI